MRIVGYLESDACKITVFHQGMRFTVKFEDGLYEQSFKFRESEQIKGIEDIRSLIDEEFVGEVKQRFLLMRQSVGQLMDRYLQQNNDIDVMQEEEEEII